MRGYLIYGLTQLSLEKQTGKSKNGQNNLIRFYSDNIVRLHRN
jgi:hypothetical protein